MKNQHKQFDRWSNASASRRRRGVLAESERGKPTPDATTAGRVVEAPWQNGFLELGPDTSTQQTTHITSNVA